MQPRLLVIAGIVAASVVTTSLVAERWRVRELPVRVKPQPPRDKVELFGSDMVKPMYPGPAPKLSPEQERKRQAEWAAVQEYREEFAQQQAQGAAAMKMPAAVQVLRLPDVKQWLAEAKASGFVVSASVTPDKTDSRCQRVVLFRRIAVGAHTTTVVNGRWRACEGLNPVLLWRETPRAYDQWLSDVHGRPSAK